MSRLMAATAVSEETSMTRASSTIQCSVNCVAAITCVAINWKPEDGSCELVFYTEMGISQLEQEEGVISYAVDGLL